MDRQYVGIDFHRAVATSSRFRVPTTIAAPSVGAVLGSDGRTLTIIFVGAAAGHGTCTAEYKVEQLASNTAVAVAVRETRPEVGTCADVGYSRTKRIELKSPLGNRVLVDAKTKAAVATAH